MMIKKALYISKHERFGTFLHRVTYRNTQGNWQMQLYLRQLEKKTL